MYCRLVESGRKRIHLHQSLSYMKDTSSLQGPRDAVCLSTNHNPIEVTNLQTMSKNSMGESISLQRFKTPCHLEEITSMKSFADPGSVLGLRIFGGSA